MELGTGSRFPVVIWEPYNPPGVGTHKIFNFIGGFFLKEMDVLIERKKAGWDWLVGFGWVGRDLIQKIWFANQIDRYAKMFDLSENDVKRLKREIAEKGVRAFYEKRGISLSS